MTTVAIAKTAAARVSKGKHGVYFAWGAFAKYNGELFVDEHGDDIPGEEFIGASLSLAKSAKLGHEHDGTVNGSVPLVFPLTEDIQTALDLTSPHAGLVVGFQPTGAMAKSLDAGDEWELSIAGFGEAHAVAATIAKSADGADLLAKAKHKRTLRNLVIEEISLVKRGAHGAGTKIAIAKRGDGAAPADDALSAARVAFAASTRIAKRAPAMTDPTNGHQHLIYDAEEADGGTSYEVMPGAEYGHSHPWVRLADGSLSIGEAAGHSHTVNTEQAAMADDLAKSLLAAQADVAKARQFTADILAMPIEQLAYAKRLDAPALAVFVAKSATERAALATPVYVAKRGRAYFAADEAAGLVELAKAHDAMVVELEKARGDAATVEIAKTAATIPFIKSADLIAKAVHALPEADRKAALDGLVAVNASLATLCKPIGSGAAQVTSGADAQLDAMAADLAKTHSVSIAKGFDLALQTPAGAALYAQAEEARKRATAGN